MRPLLLILSLCAALHITAQHAAKNLSTLTIPQIMQGEEFVGSLPEDIFWSYDSKFIYFTWNPDGDTLRSLYKVDRDGNEPEKVSLEEEQQLPGNRGDYNLNRTKKVYAKYGDLHILDAVSGNSQRLTNTVERESNPQFIDGGNAIVFQKGNNLYSHQLKSGLLTQLTDFQMDSEAKDRKNNDQRQWLEDDQLAYFDILEQRKMQREARERRSEQLQPDRPLTIYTNKQRINNLQVSPDLRYVTYRLTKRAKSQNTNVPNFVTETGYTEDLRSRSKVGSPQDTYSLHVYDRERDTTYEVKSEQLAGIYDKPAFYRDYVKAGASFKPKFEKPRDVIMHGPIYSEKGNRGIVVVRSMDNKDRWITQLMPETGELKLLERQHDDAWVGGPGISGWNFSSGNVDWIDDQTIYFQSEETGYSHLYSMNVVTAEKLPLTTGDFEIIDATLSNSKKYFYLTANVEGPEFHHFYRMNATGGGMTQITTNPGNHQVTLSPDERFLAVRYSYANQPWELYAQTNSYKAEHARLTTSVTEEFSSYNWRDPEIVRFTARDGAEVPARIYRPDSLKNNGAAVVFVHGAGYLQNVHKWWSSYYREYMFHNFLTDNGYTVLDIDYRASNGYGRDWRTAIYQHMG
ncbi:MAG: DPP IV N-terminal domain-containing protein, partial [Saprospiraceae bacterium]